MIDAIDFRSPNEMARHIAKYASCPSTIVAATANYFGRSQAVTREKAEQLIAKRQASLQRGKSPSRMKGSGSDESDAVPYAIQPLGNKDVLASIKVPTPPVAKALWPAWYKPAPANTARSLITSVGASLGMTFDEMLGDARRGVNIAARSVVYKILREQGHSYPWIGKQMAGRDHTTVMNAVEKFDYYCERYPVARDLYEQFRGKPDAR